MPRPKLTLSQIFKRNKDKSRKSSAPRKKITMGSATLKQVKPPKVTGDWNIANTSPRVMSGEQKKALSLLKDLLEFDAENEILLYEVFGKKSSLKREVVFEVADHQKLPKKINIEGVPRTITTILLKHKTKNIYFWMQSTRSFYSFADWVCRFIAICPPKGVPLEIKDLQGNLLDFSKFVVLDLLNMEEYQDFF